MTTIDFAQEQHLFGGNYDHLQIGLGIESEQVQRAAKAQIMRNLPSITEQLQNIWDERDRAFAEEIGGSFQKLTIPKVEKSNFYTGVKPSFVEAGLDLWPAVIVYAKDAKGYQSQEDQFDTYSIPLCIEIMCKEGPIATEIIHEKEGQLLEVKLDSQLQRLSDAVHLCIRKDPTLGSTIMGVIEKPPNAIQSLPWARSESKSVTGQSYIFQGKQFEYYVQKNSF